MSHIGHCLPSFTIAIICYLIALLAVTWCEAVTCSDRTRRLLEVGAIMMAALAALSIMWCARDQHPWPSCPTS